MELLKRFADQIEFDMELDPQALQAAIESDVFDSNGRKIISGRKINDDRTIIPMSPFEHSKYSTHLTNYRK